MYSIRGIIYLFLLLQCAPVGADEAGGASNGMTEKIVGGLKAGWDTYKSVFTTVCQQMTANGGGTANAGNGLYACDNGLAITVLLAIWCYSCCTNCCRRRPRGTKLPKQIIYHVGYKPGEKTPKQDLYQEVCHESEKDLGPPPSASSPSSCSTSSQSSPSQAPESEEEQPESNQSGKRERVKGRREQRMEKALKGKSKR
eukprot:XP_002261175.1 hypothetical protein PKH_031930 [Plasmodium knowlesi strain H]